MLDSSENFQKRLATSPHTLGLAEQKVQIRNSFYFFSQMIVACEAATNCSGHGTCRDDGACDCDSQFFSADCSSN